jgi:hypothetical protein
MWSFLNFWTRIKPVDLPYPREAWPGLRSRIATMSDPEKVLAREAWERDLDLTHADYEATRSKAGGLYLAVGLISGLTGLTGQGIAALSGTDLDPNFKVLILATAVFVALLLLYFAFGTAFLAYRAQEVAPWGYASVELPAEEGPQVNHADEYLLALFTGSRNNQERLTTPVGYLAQAQQYVGATLVLLAMLVLILMAVASIGALLPHSTTAVPAASGAHHPAHRLH